jgi:hypothetical protein
METEPKNTKLSEEPEKQPETQVWDEDWDPKNGQPGEWD